jgi:hypothetical protein
MLYSSLKTCTVLMSSRSHHEATGGASAMSQGSEVRPRLPPVGGKPVHLACDGGRLISDVGVLLLLAHIERRLGIAERLARCIDDPRDPAAVQHSVVEMTRFRALLIAAGYPDANDCDARRRDPAFNMVLGRPPESGAELCSQPTMSRLENVPGPVGCLAHDLDGRARGLGNTLAGTGAVGEHQAPLNTP